MSLEPKLETSSPSCSPDVSVSLLDRVSDVVRGEQTTDVLTVGAALVQHACILLAGNKEEALKALDVAYLTMADNIDLTYRKVKDAHGSAP